jgi:hypothetical protein
MSESQDDPFTQGAKALFDAFMLYPPFVEQTRVGNRISAVRRTGAVNALGVKQPGAPADFLAPLSLAEGGEFRVTMGEPYALSPLGEQQQDRPRRCRPTGRAEHRQSRRHAGQQAEVAGFRALVPRHAGAIPARPVVLPKLHDHRSHGNDQPHRSRRRRHRGQRLVRPPSTSTSKCTGNARHSKEPTYMATGLTTTITYRCRRRRRTPPSPCPTPPIRQANLNFNKKWSWANGNALAAGECDLHEAAPDFDGHAAGAGPGGNAHRTSWATRSRCRRFVRSSWSTIQRPPARL